MPFKYESSTRVSVAEEAVRAAGEVSPGAEKKGEEGIYRWPEPVRRRRGLVTEGGGSAR